VVQAAADLPVMLLAEVGTLFQYICSQCERALVNRQGEQPIDLRVCLAQTGEEAQLVFTLEYEGLPPGPAGEALMDMGSVLSLVSGHCPQPAYSRLLDHVCAELEQRLRAEVRLQTLRRGRQQLRLALPVEVLPPLEQLPAEVWGGRALRVLLVEDHPVQQMAIRRLLNKELPMAELAFAANAEQALQLAAESDFKLALVDLELPDMPGWELISSLRKQRPLPVIALTAKASYDEEARALTAGAQAYLQKPLLPAELLPCLQEMLLAHSPQQ
jgi:CheY-like chemotaxis protein